MKFHPDKCKVVTIKHKPSPLAMLPFVAYHYHLGENLLSYADSEKDLGVLVNKSFNFNEQCKILLTKVNAKSPPKVHHARSISIYLLCPF